MADQWRITTTTNQGTDADITTNWERNDTSGYSSIGTGLTESSGIFSFPQTGIYLIYYVARIQTESDTSANVLIKITTNNSSYSDVGRTASGNNSSTANVNSSSNTFIFDVTDITTHKFKFTTLSFATNTFLSGSSTEQRTGFTVIRLGDT